MHECVRACVAVTSGQMSHLTKLYFIFVRVSSKRVSQLRKQYHCAIIMLITIAFSLEVVSYSDNCITIIIKFVNEGLRIIGYAGNKH